MTYIEKLKALIHSRRFQATIASVLTVVFQDILGLDLQSSLIVVGAIQSWVVGDSISKTV
jgi:phosphate/sulfate permease